MMRAASALLLSASLLVPPDGRVRVNMVSDRRQRRLEYWQQRAGTYDDDDRGGRDAAATRGPRAPAPPHPLAALVEHYAGEAQSATFSGARALTAGESTKVVAINSSPLGLNVATVPDGEPGLVYNDEAGYVPDASGETVGPGDVVTAFVTKVRASDGRLDFAFRPPGAMPKLAGGASALLDALFESEGGDVALGDASSPAAIKLALGMSKSTFKAARGALLKRGLLEYPLSPHETRLRAGAERPQQETGGGEASGGGGAAARGAWFELVELPPAVYYERGGRYDELPPWVGAAAIIDLASTYGEVLSVRGMRRHDGEPTGTARVHMASPAAAAVAADALSRFEAPPYVRRPPPPQPAGARRREARAASASRREEGAPASLSCFVGNLDAGTSADDLWDVFGECGYIQGVEVVQSDEGARAPSAAATLFGKIRFADGDGVRKALLLRGTRLRGRALRVEVAREDEGGAEGGATEEAYQGMVESEHRGPARHGQRDGRGAGERSTWRGGELGEEEQGRAPRAPRGVTAPASRPRSGASPRGQRRSGGGGGGGNRWLGGGRR